jgi:hypothetical protein
MTAEQHARMTTPAEEGPILMTEGDEHATSGPMVARLSEAKQRRAALLSKAQEAGQLLADAASTLQNVNFVDAFWDERQGGYARTTQDVTLREYPDHPQANALLNELRVVSAEIRGLRRMIKDTGIDVD